MKRLKLFEYFTQEDKLEDNPFLLNSRNGIYLFSIGSWQSWLTFLDSFEWLYSEIGWPFNPKITASGERLFNLLNSAYPTFCVIIDTNDDQIYGVSLNQEGELGVFVDKKGDPVSKEKFTEYLDQLGLSVEDL